MHDQIAAAVDDLRMLVEGDGAILEIVDTDTTARTAHLRLDLSQVECPECVLPGSMLEEMIAAHLRTAVGDVRVVLDDPRAEPTSAHPTSRHGSTKEER